MLDDRADMTLVDRLYLHGRERGDAPAFMDSRDCVSWSQLDAATNRIANALIAVGVARGARVAVLSDTRLQAALLMLGTLKAAASAVPLPTLIGGDAIARIVEDSAARVLFVATKCRPLVTERLMNLPLARVAIDFEETGWLTLGDLLAAAPIHAPPVRPRSTDEFNVIYSSGTTGKPKGIVHGHGLRASWARGARQTSFPAGARTLTTTALYSNWTIGAMINTLWVGGCVRLLEKFGSAEMVRACKEFRPHNVFLVPVQIARLLDDSDAARSLPHLPAATKWSAGSYLAAERKRTLMQQWPGGFIEIYGMTEGAPSTMLLGHERPDKLHTVGRCDPPDDIKIIGEDGVELGVGARGEIVGRAIDVMDGYNNNPEASQAIVWRDLHGNAFFRSGDIGSLDAEGFLRVTDRKKDMIISGGFNIYASDLEEVLAAHPAIAEVAVFALPSTRWGETPAAAAVLRAGADVGEDELLRWANERLGRLQRLSTLVIASEVPRGSLGKILKRELRNMYAHLREDTAGST